MKPVLRLLLRIPYFYYWSWKEYPYNFELWLSFYGMGWLANHLIKNLKVIVPKEYYEFIKKYPDFKPYYPELRVTNTRTSNNTFYHYEAPKEDKK